MLSAPLPENEEQRLEELIKYELLDTDDEQALDELTELAADICGVPISLISLVDHDRQWFKSRVGVDATETGRDIAFCSHAILQEKIFEVPDAAEDERFFDNPLVTSAPDIRFYAGAPLITKDGFALGTLCVIDREPKVLSASQRTALATLSRQVVRQLELRLQHRRLKRMNVEREKFYAIMAHDLRSPFNGILGLSRILKEGANSLPPEKISEVSDKILGSSLDVFQVLDEILQWSQLRIGKTDCDIEILNLRDILNSALTILLEALTQKSITLNDSVSSKISILADATLTKTVLRNVLSNAIKYSPAGASIDISAYEEGEQVVVRVQDRGPGVSKEQQEKLFSQNVTSERGSEGETGFGMGLTLCQDFMRMQGAFLRIDENYDQGAALELVLPRSAYNDAR